MCATCWPAHREGEGETYIEADYGSSSIGVEGHCKRASVDGNRGLEKWYDWSDRVQDCGFLLCVNNTDDELAGE